MKLRSQSLKLECLEDRRLLSTCHITRLSDVGAGMGFRGDLRYCINKVNAEPGPDVINFNVTGTIYLNGSLPNLESEVSIQGPGRDLVTIDAQAKSRVFYVAEGALVDISGMTLTGGKPNFEYGGGIYNAGGLVLRDCAIHNNRGFHFGGGIYNQGTLFISECSIDQNLVFIHQGYNTFGGGIYNATSGFLLIQRTQVFNNSIQPSYSYTALGGGIANFGKAALFESTISGNMAHVPYEGTIAGFGGGIFNSRGEIVVDSSLITMNVAAGDWYAAGGGIGNGASSPHKFPGGRVTVINSTIANNLAFGNGDMFGYAQGGGISTEFGGLVEVAHSTIATNKSDREASYVESEGGGLYNDGSLLRVHHSIIAENLAKTRGNDISGSLASSGYSLWESTDGGSGYALTDILNVDPMLGPLQDNGGPTLTHSLLPGSPAIDAGDPLIEDAPAFDQRGPGFPRIVNDTIDIGAFEVQSTGAPPALRVAHVRSLERIIPIFATADLESLDRIWR